METVILVQTYKSEGGVSIKHDVSLEDIPLTLKVTRRRRLEDEAKYLFLFMVYLLFICLFNCIFFPLEWYLTFFHDLFILVMFVAPT